MTTTPATGDDELRLMFQRVARRIRNNRSADVSDSQLSVLFHLDLAGSCSPSELAEHDRVTPPSMNRTLNGLEHAGLIRRDPSPVDARKVLVSLTASGNELIAETRRLRTAWFSQRLAELTAEERAALEVVVPILKRLADS